MKFMMLMIPAVYQGGKKVDPGFTPDPEKMEEMGRFNDQMGKSLKIESLNGLLPQMTGARVSFSKGKPTLVDGPSIETKEVVGGYWIVEAKSKEEVVEWALRCPADDGDVIEDKNREGLTWGMANGLSSIYTGVALLCGGFIIAHSSFAVLFTAMGIVQLCATLYVSKLVFFVTPKTVTQGSSITL